MLPVIVLIGIIGIIFLVVAGVIVWLLGLLTAIIFAIITLLFLYAFHELDMIDIQQDRWLLFTPFIMFFVGLGLDKTGVLQIQPLSLNALLTNLFTLSATNVFLLIIILLLLVDIAVSRR
jgi:predicted outer membrane lipoprotein